MPLDKETHPDDRYKLLRQIGKGSEGKVYLAFQTQTFRFYAVKEIEKKNVCFSREGLEVWKRLKHEGLPQIEDIREDEQKIRIVMEYIEGETIKSRIRRQGKPSEKLLLEWSIEICEILEYLHGQNPPIIYGDLKPSNVILQRNRPVLTDLGSSVLRGSRGKRTGTCGYAELSEQPQVQEDIRSFGRFLEKLSGDNMGKDWQEIVKKAEDSRGNRGFFSMEECRKELEKYRRKPFFRSVMLAGAFVFLVSGFLVSQREYRKRSQETEYEDLLMQAGQLQGEEKQELLGSTVKKHPEQAETYLELLDAFLEDSVFSEEEDIYYRKLLKTPDENTGRTPEEVLVNNLEGYGKVAYETGIAYWYFYEGREGKNNAVSWFARVCDLPEQAGSEKEELGKSRLYRQIGEDHIRMEHYEISGQGEEGFLSYWESIRQLGKTGAGKDRSVRLMFWRESISVLRKYLPEFCHVGITREQFEEYLQQAERELLQLSEDLPAFSGQIEEVRQEKQLLEEAILRAEQNREKEDLYENY